MREPVSCVSLAELRGGSRDIISKLCESCVFRSASRLREHTDRTPLSKFSGSPRFAHNSRSQFSGQTAIGQASSGRVPSSPNIFFANHNYYSIGDSDQTMTVYDPVLMVGYGHPDDEVIDDELEALLDAEEAAIISGPDEKEPDQLSF